MASAMRAKTKVVVKLISPREAFEGCEVHAVQNKMFCVRCRVRCGKDLNHPPTAQTVSKVANSPHGSVGMVQILSTRFPSNASGALRAYRTYGATHRR